MVQSPVVWRDTPCQIEAMAWARAKMGMSLALSFGEAARVASPMETDCLGFARRHGFRAQRKAGDRAFVPQPTPQPELPGGQRKQTFCQISFPHPHPPLKRPIVSLSRDRKVVGAPHCLLLNDECVARQDRQDMAHPRNRGLWRLALLGLPLPTVCGLA